MTIEEVKDIYNHPFWKKQPLSIIGQHVDMCLGADSYTDYNSEVWIYEFPDFIMKISEVDSTVTFREFK